MFDGHGKMLVTNALKHLHIKKFFLLKHIYGTDYH